MARFVAVIRREVLVPSLGRQCESLFGADSNGGNACEPLHMHGNRTVIGGAIAQLAPRVPAPGPDGAVRLECESGVTISGDRGDPREVLHLHWNQAVLKVTTAPFPH